VYFKKLRYKSNVYALTKALIIKQFDAKLFKEKCIGWDDIGYSFLIGGDGRVYEGRGWGYQGAHTFGFNSVSFGASFIGNFMQKLPTRAAITGMYICSLFSQTSLMPCLV